MNLIEAIENNDLEKVKELISQGADVNAEYKIIRTVDIENIEPIYQHFFYNGFQEKRQIGEKTVRYAKDVEEKYYPLPFAISKNNIPIINYLLFCGAEYKENYYGIELTELITACVKNKIEQVKELLSKGKYVEEYKNAALIYSSKYGHLEIVKYLIDKGAKDLNGALLAASPSDNLDLVKYLIENGAKNFNEALLAACPNGHLEIVKYLVDKGAKNFNEALLAACPNGHFEIVKYLVGKGATNLDAALDIANKYNYLPIINFLLFHGADCKLLYTLEQTELITACIENKIEQVRKLLDSAKYSQNYKNVALDCANKYNYFPIIDVLLFYGADYKSLSKKTLEQTELITACIENKIEKVRELLSKGKYVQDYKNLTLIYSSKNGHLEIVRCLLEHNATDLNGALKEASSNGHLAIVKYLIDKGAKDLNGALLEASRYGHLEIVKYLIEKDATNLNDALDIANEQNYLPIMDILLFYGADSKLLSKEKLKQTELITACVEGKIDQVKELLNSAKYHENYKNAALIRSSKNGHLEIVKYLIDKGEIDLNVALLAVTSDGYLNLVKYLVEHNATYLNGALLVASVNGHPEIVKYLIRNGAKDFDHALFCADAHDYLSDVHNYQSDYYIPFFPFMGILECIDFDDVFICGDENNYLPIIDVLLFNGANYEWFPKEKLKQTELITACIAGKIDQVKELLDSAKYHENYKNAALIYSSEYGHLEIVKYLIDKGATDLNRALKEASANGHPKIVKYLIDKGAKDLNGALLEASRYGHLEIVKYLIEKDATNLTDALHLAEVNDYLPIVDVLLFHGADSRFLYVLEETELITACIAGKIDQVKELLDSAKYHENYKNAALIHSSEYGHLEIVKYLIDKGATDLNGALIAASKYKHLEIVEYLRKHRGF